MTLSPQIRAATLAGGANNQDRYVIGDGFVAVLDGATSSVPLAQDAGWYAEQLGDALRGTIGSSPTLPDAVERAIATVRDRHGLTAPTAPTSTVAIARWDETVVDTYVLGDTSVLLFGPEGTTLLVDRRMAQVAVEHRAAAAAHLADGRGYDTHHRQILTEIRAQEMAWRNRSGGYWIAGIEPEAAAHGLTRTVDRAGLRGLAIASDGIPAAVVDDEWPVTSPERLLQDCHDQERTDPVGRRRPRSKPHDDKTLVVVTFPADASKR
jgi:hypothetical protein